MLKGTWTVRAKQVQAEVNMIANDGVLCGVLAIGVEIPQLNKPEIPQNSRDTSERRNKEREAE